MAKKYKTKTYQPTCIDEVNIDRESAQSVWIDGKRRAKTSEHVKYHDTWEDARNYLLATAQQKVLRAKIALERESSILGNVKGMKKP